MNSPDQCILVYHSHDKSPVQDFSEKVSRIGISFVHLSEISGQATNTISTKLLTLDGPLILFLSDVFLKDISCVSGLLTALKEKQEKHHPILIITLKNSHRNPNAIEYLRFQKVAEVLHYVRYWQDHYLQLRQNNIKAANKDLLEPIIRNVYQISRDIDQLIEWIKEHGYFSGELFEANDYELFFQKCGYDTLYRRYQEMALFDENDKEVESKVIKMLEEKMRAEQKPAFVETDPFELPELKTEPTLHTEEVSNQNPLLQKLNEYKNTIQPPSPVPSSNTEQLPTMNPSEPEISKPIPMESNNGISYSNDDLLIQAATLVDQDSEFNQVISLIEQVLRKDPKNFQAFYLLGRLAARNHELQLTKNYFEKAIEYHPGHLPSILGLYQCLMQMDAPDYKKLHSLLKLAKKAHPDQIDLLIALANVKKELGKSSKKIKKILKTVLLLQPSNEVANQLLASLHFAKGDTLKALEHHRSTQKPKHSKKLEQETSIKSSEKYLQPVALITGASSGIGREIALKLSKEGFHLILISRREQKLLEVIEKIRDRSPKSIVTHAICDIRNPESIEEFIKNLPQEFRQIDILVNNAGLAKGFAPIQEGSFDHWNQMIDTNLRGLLYMTRLIVPGMVERRKGHIINIGSIAGKEVYPSGNVYCATKSAVDALTRAMRIDLYQYGIKVSQIAPGHVEDTEFAEVRFDGDKERAAIYKDFSPLKSEDIANAVHYVLTQPPHINVQDLVLLCTQQAGATYINRSGRIFDQK